MRNLIFDTCFWFALYDSDDQYHEVANRMFSEFANHDIKIIIPFPTLYETLNTAFVDNKVWLSNFDKILTNERIVKLVDDTDYCNDALISTMYQKKTKVSLVDNIIRHMVVDTNLRIDAVVSFNERDFADLCRERQIPLLSFAGGLF